MKQVWIIVGCVVIYLISVLGGVIGGGIVGYHVGYDDAMVEVQTRVLNGLDQLGEMFHMED